MLAYEEVELFRVLQKDGYDKDAYIEDIPILYYLCTWAPSTIGFPLTFQQSIYTICLTLGFLSPEEYFPANGDKYCAIIEQFKTSGIALLC